MRVAVRVVVRAAVCVAVYAVPAMTRVASV